ncbi:MAG: hypothetical protein KGQ28_12125, partial [Hyphomicrobiales bacterium]|nr:hypothetical protein [Hyphomicrobiales bacterium]
SPCCSKVVSDRIRSMERRVILLGKFLRDRRGVVPRDLAFAAALFAVLGVAAASRLSQASEDGSLAGAMAFLGAKDSPLSARFGSVDMMATGAIGPRLNPCKLDPAPGRLPSMQ